MGLFSRLPLQLNLLKNIDVCRGDILCNFLFQVKRQTLDLTLVSILIGKIALTGTFLIELTLHRKKVDRRIVHFFTHGIIT